MNNNNYEYINVDPRVIQMFGGDEDISPLNESVDDSPKFDVDSSIFASNTPNNMFQPQFPPLNNMVGQSENKSSEEAELLKLILKELKQIEIMLAGKE